MFVCLPPQCGRERDECVSERGGVQVVALYRSVAALPVGLLILNTGMEDIQWLRASLWTTLAAVGGWVSWYTYSWIMSKQPAPKVTAMLYFKVRRAHPLRLGRPHRRPAETPPSRQGVARGSGGWKQPVRMTHTLLYCQPCHFLTS